MEYFNITDPSDLYYPMFIYSWGVFSVGLPVSFLAVYGLYFQIKADHVTPVYVINLLISDVLQLCAKPTFLSIPPLGMVYELMVFIYALGLLSSTMFMVCIAAERYCMIAHPVWFRFRREIKNSIFVSFCVWLVAMATVTIVVLSGLAGIVDVRKLLLATMILSLLPYPFVLFFFMGTWRALSMSIALSRHERRRILGILAFVLCVYTVLFLPHMVVILILYIKPAFMKSV
ncbi:G-protein coupled receptor 4 [Denticeps clupeoides]|uniref:G-protein coupled receptor 4 n=1 Tax=Denticeps clupeoides TaxID=299321 RepID=UPI0010A58AF5|nr:G-protein coupled receptor 4-like [Denticeps clupeoides]